MAGKMLKGNINKNYFRGEKQIKYYNSYAKII